MPADAPISDRTDSEAEVNQDHAENTIALSMGRLAKSLGIPEAEADDSFSEDISQPTTHAYFADNGRFADKIRRGNG